ncbi:MAG TPA: outer membrane beta-barrel protein [Steroidobacteraceae bacterium]|jgi:opacity protein-like surface antigen|nr:outer membrane beta-barrel protein [Steroidobacteraceae bacterium]
MKNRLSRCKISFVATLALPALILCSLGATTAAHADDLLGLYVGASLGQAHVRTRPTLPGIGPIGDLDQTHTAFKGMAGIRVLSFLGAEVAYMDFGKVSSMAGTAFSGPQYEAIVNSEQASQKGEAAFAVLYLPVPIIDIYVKAGLSRITTDFNATYTEYTPGVGVGTCQIGHPNCGAIGQFSASHDATDTSFAYGAGLQWKLGHWAVRGEYERFHAAGANPTLLSIGMTYWIL